ncbi:MAG: radical SAM protein [Thermodesulfobacteriota bacterium]|nr:radical SAM protein [Thermodesulfobacteriota bacterium]
MMKKKVLFIYPTPYRITLTPLGIGSLCGVLQKNGYDIKVFDTAYYPECCNDQEEARYRIKTGMSPPSSDKELMRIKDRQTDIYDDLSQCIKEYNPDLIGISLVDASYYIIGKSIIEFIKNQFPEIFMIAGGVFPTLRPGELLNDTLLDAVCVGEGEESLLELSDSIISNTKRTDIKGIWFRNKDKIIKNSIRPPIDIAKLPTPYYQGMDQGLFFKPMKGKIYKMINIATARGCPYQCTYCCASSLKQVYQQEDGHYYRVYPIEKVIYDIKNLVRIHKPEFIYFSTESFLAMPERDVDYFIKYYKGIGLPFWGQTRPETVTKEKLEKLKSVGLRWISIGVEHGNEEFRKKVLNRKFSNEHVERVVKYLEELEIGASLNNIIGFPSENRKLIFDTINFCRKLYKINKRLIFTCFRFTPLKGSELYNQCIKQGLLDKDTNYSGSVFSVFNNPLKYSDEWKKELNGLAKTFNLHVKLPENKLPTVELAEKDSEEGEKIFNELRELISV